MQTTTHRGYNTDFRIGHAVFVCLSYIVSISKITMYADTINVGSVPDFESVCMSYVELEGEVG